MGKKIVAFIGEVCLDRFIYGEVKRISPESPVPVFIPKKKIASFGMAQNVFKNFISLAQDAFDVCTYFPSSGSPTKTRYVEEHSNHQFLRVDEDHEVFDAIQVRSSIQKFVYNLPKDHDVAALVISDYNKGLLRTEDLEEISNSATLKGIKTFIDTKKPLGKWIGGFDFIKINHSEYLQSSMMREDDLLLTLIRRGQLIITEGVKGVNYVGTNIPVEVTHPIQDVCGAGDTFLAALVYQFLCQEVSYPACDFDDKIKCIKNACGYANAAAAYAVTQRGVVVVKPSDFSYCNGKQERSDPVSSTQETKH